MAKKHKKNKYLLPIIALVGVAAFIYFYSGGTTASLFDKQVTFTISDAELSSDITAVYIEISKIIVHNDKTGMWMPVTDNVPEINLLELNTSNYIVGTVNVSNAADLGEVKIEITDIKIVDHTGTKHPILPSNTIKFRLDFNSTDSENTVNFDFNLADSIVQQGTGSYLFKPVIAMSGYKGLKPTISSVCKAVKLTTSNRCVVRPITQPHKIANYEMADNGVMNIR